MGEMAESAFEREWGDDTFVRTGFNRPPIDTRKINRTLMYMPDYLTDHGFYEVQGVGRDGIVKFKKDKLVALSAWSSFTQTAVWLWIYDSVNNVYAVCSNSYMLECCNAGKFVTETFPEGKEYWAVPTAWFTDEEVGWFSC